MHQPQADTSTTSPSPTLPQGEAVWNEFLRRVHTRLEVETVGFVVVNEGRVLLGCDRVALILAERRSPRLAAVSGQSTVDRRSNVAAAWETFADAAGRSHETLVLDGSPMPGAPVVEAASARLVDVTEARQTVFVPILSPVDELATGTAASRAKATGQAADVSHPECLGWLIGERFTSPASADLLARQAEKLASVSAPALANALQYERLPLRRLGERLRRLRDRKSLSRTLLLLLATASAIAALTLIRVELKVQARGTLEPRERRHVFAPVEGVIVGLDVKHGQDVEAGRRLLVMRRPELEFELARVGGELETERRRLQSIEAARLRGAASGATTDLGDRIRLTAEEEEVRQRLAGLQLQHDELTHQRRSLDVTAPIAGRVLTWDVERQLDGRPVAKGRQLLTVGRVEGPWDLELTVDDRYAGYVRRAQSEGEPVGVEFFAASSAGETHRAVLTTIAARGETDEHSEAVVPATAAVDDGVPRELLHPGGAVTAKIHCGRTAVGYVWFIDVIHFVRTRILF
jgi:multidrug efflux pump subunit AcrA (membrane-fusion protein)